LKRPRIEKSDKTIDKEPSPEPASAVEEEEEVLSERISAVDETGPEPPVSAIEGEALTENPSSPTEATDTVDVDDNAPAAASSSKGEKGDGTFKENPYIYLPQDHPLLQACLYVADDYLAFVFTLLNRLNSTYTEPGDSK
jgi:hypothetical protein